jgi:hypothetical protein
MNSAGTGRRWRSRVVATIATGAVGVTVGVIGITNAMAATSGAITGYGGKCVDVAAANPANGTQIQLYTCNGTNAQQWTVAWQGNAFALVSVNSGKCAAIEGDGGTKQRDCRDDTSQRWTVQAG